jgi:hypothetical protein
LGWLPNKEGFQEEGIVGKKGAENMESICGEEDVRAVARLENSNHQGSTTEGTERRKNQTVRTRVKKY